MCPNRCVNGHLLIRLNFNQPFINLHQRSLSAAVGRSVETYQRTLYFSGTVFNALSAYTTGHLPTSRVYSQLLRYLHSYTGRLRDWPLCASKASQETWLYTHYHPIHQTRTLFTRSPLPYRMHMYMCMYMSCCMCMCMCRMCRVNK